MKFNVYTFIFLLFNSLNSISQSTISQPVMAQVNINSFMSLKVSKTSDLDFKFNSTDQLESGIVKNSVLQVRIKSNKNWQLSVSSLTPNMLSAGPDSYTIIPAEIFSIKKSNLSTFIPVRQNPTSITNGQRGTDTGNNNFLLDLRAKPGLENGSGFYSVVLIFTISPQ